MKLIRFKRKGRQKYTQRAVVEEKRKARIKRPTEIYFSSSNQHNCVIEAATTTLYLLISFPQWSVQYL